MELRTTWPTIPAGLRTSCHRVAGLKVSQSYSVLNSCLEMESKAATRNSGRRFRY